MSSSSPVRASDDVPEHPKPFPGVVESLPMSQGSGRAGCLWLMALSSLTLTNILNSKARGSGPGLMSRTSSSPFLVSSSPRPGSSDLSNHHELLGMTEKLQRDLHYLESSLVQLRFVEDYVVSQFVTMERFLCCLHEILCQETPPSAFPVLLIKDQLRSLDQLVSHLKHQMPSLHFLPPGIVSRGTPSPWAGGSNPYHLLKEKDAPDVKDKMKMNEDFNRLKMDFQEAFQGLLPSTIKCLLCFSAFPANVVIEKRLLKYWWIGESLVKTDLSQTESSQLTTDGVLEELMSKGFIDPILKKRRVVGFQVNPLVRFVILSRAEEHHFLEFDKMGMPVERLSPYRVCLVGSDGNSKRPIYSSSDQSDSELEKAITIFNINDSHPHLRKKWLSKLKRLKVLHLGGWPGSTNCVVEIENPQFLRGIKGMKDLQLLSLQGVSGIDELPDSILELTDLKILDLKACHNLAKLPQKLHKLQKLTHLDISGCYWLDHMPKGVASLSELRVLKGFVVGRTTHGDSCSLHDLVRLQKLRKLCINAGEKNFPGEKDLEYLRGFKDLQKLAISWGNSPSGNVDDHSQKPAAKYSYHKGEPEHQGEGLIPNESNSRRLKKLEMQGFPGMKLPVWATEGKLRPRDKLNIRGGNLYTLSGKLLEVRIVSLKFLGELSMDWRELMDSFPKLVYLEKVRCPKLKFFPCNEDGVWINEEAKHDTDLGLPWSFLTSPDYA